MNELNEVVKSNRVQMGHASAKQLIWTQLGQYKYRILQDGAQTQSRLGIIEWSAPPRAEGPGFCFHEKHEECFYVTKGQLRIQIPGRPHVDAGPFDLVTIPLFLPYRFSNPFDEEVVFVNTLTPSFFVEYFRNLQKVINGDTDEGMEDLMRRFATVPMTPQMVEDYVALSKLE
ncbi:Cupin domain-containing protein [Diaporthe eres]|nr:Cupin domain-containing protein [Diaporthe eres]